MHGRRVQPPARLGKAMRVTAVELPEDVLRHVLRLRAVVQHALCDCDDPAILDPEESLERVLAHRTGGLARHRLSLRFHLLTKHRRSAFCDTYSPLGVQPQFSVGSVAASPPAPPVDIGLSTIVRNV